MKKEDRKYQLRPSVGMVMGCRDVLGIHQIVTNCLKHFLLP